MVKRTKKLKLYEDFESEVSTSIDVERLNKLVDMSTPLLDEIGKIIQQDDDRTISIEMYNDIVSAIETLEQIKRMY